MSLEVKNVYIPCYFNGIKEREENFYKNIEQYLKLGYNVTVYWMNNQEILIKNKNLTVIKGEQVLAGKARNVLLNIFYNTNDDFAIFSDDDTFLNKKISVKGYDCISLVNDKNIEFAKTVKINSAFLILSNFKKKNNLTPLFDETLDSNQDLDFGMTLYSLGLESYRKSTEDVVIYKGKSSMFTSISNRIYKKQQSFNLIINKRKHEYSKKHI